MKPVIILMLMIGTVFFYPKLVGDGAHAAVNGRSHTNFPPDVKVLLLLFAFAVLERDTKSTSSCNSSCKKEVAQTMHT